MKLPGRLIAKAIEARFKKEVKALKKKGIVPCLVTFLIGDSAEQLSFVAIKQKTAKKLGIKFEFRHLKKTPSFEEFAHILKECSQNPKVTGVLIQLPLPPMLATDSIYNFIPIVKEIEGHKAKTPFLPPLGLAVLTMIKYTFGTGKINHDLIIDMEKDKIFFRNVLKHKKIIVVGRGLTGGQPIGKTLSELKINYLSINSHTYSPEEYYKDADIIITAAGTTVLKPEFIKPGVILLNAGLHKENGTLVGDYCEKEIEKIASHYSTTPGGVGPLDVLYLFNNVIQAAKLQNS
ncbi:MAG: bifunctional 5,10-methylenetetrahydrofolate dehydrogenase/5,10-methenyltetrahydrofolate cyclohydrolase [Candidatus Roizmanbacteria bacterium]|nr:MAG: bifunctional 5,10-methylenetetrahydrofolate dehydrogenase/5,10-methenyltetrahydrofolate cyclohydrolase [Candidatus Roizmanbacteria bacterium]